MTLHKAAVVWNENKSHSIDPPYNVRREARNQTFYYDSFNKDDVTEMMGMCGDYLKRRGHAHMICSVIQFSFWT